MKYSIKYDFVCGFTDLRQDTKIFFSSHFRRFVHIFFFYSPLSARRFLLSVAGKPIKGPWEVYTFDFQDLSTVPQLPDSSPHSPTQAAHRRSLKLHSSTDPTYTTIASIISKEQLQETSDEPIFYRGILRIEGDSAQPVADAAGQLHLADSFLSTHGLGKGIAWVNGFNLGWYWPTMGPQMTLYVPGPVLQPGDNDILILEVEKVGGEAEEILQGEKKNLLLLLLSLSVGV